MFVPIEQMKLEVRILVLNYLSHKNWDHGKTLLQLRHIIPSWSASCLVCCWKTSTLYIFSSSKIYYKLFSSYFYNTEQNCKKDFKRRKLKNIVNNTKNSILMGTVYAAIHFCNFVRNKWITLNWILNIIVLWLGAYQKKKILRIESNKKRNQKQLKWLAGVWSFITQQIFHRCFNFGFRLIWRRDVVQRQINVETTLFTTTLKFTTLNNVKLALSISTFGQH